MTAQVKSLNTSKLVSDCDTRLFDLKLRLARALDERHRAIQDYVATFPPSEGFDRSPLGPITIRKVKQPTIATAEWGSSIWSWADLEGYLAEYESKPAGAEWYWLDSTVRSLLLDDTTRLLYESNVYLTRQLYPIAQSALKAINLCLEAQSCLAPSFNEADRTLLASNPIYQRFDTADRSRLEPLKKRLVRDLKAFSFHRNEAVQVADNGDLLLLLDPGAFSEVRQELEKIITEVWTSADRRLRINWTTKENIPGAFQFVAKDGSGSRSYVSYEDKSIVLYPDVKDRSIAHEIGHVLGFSDHYYTSWKPETCSYVIEDNKSDLMSISLSGRITAEEWQELKDQYPLP